MVPSTGLAGRPSRAARRTERRLLGAVVALGAALWLAGACTLDVQGLAPSDPAPGDGAGGTAGSLGWMDSGGTGATGGTAATGGTGGGLPDAGCFAGYKLCEKDCVPTDDPSYGCATTSCAPCALPNAAAVCIGGACGLGDCTPGFADCDATPGTGCETNIGADPRHCGSCVNDCFALPGATNWACSAGSCAPSQCPIGQGDCDGNAANGCETNVLSDANNCAFCTNVCVLAHAGPACSGGACVVGTCDSGYDDCDGADPNGCEQDVFTDTANCSGCDVGCSLAQANEVCNAGNCEVGSCSGGYDDCDSLDPNGCEINLATSIANCGGCNTVCNSDNGTPSCAGGNCGLSCAGSYEDCNGNTQSDGCETDTDVTLTDCGSCNKLCSSNHGSPTCSNGGCSIVCTSPYEDCTGGAQADGCETNTDTSVTHCGGCGAPCSANHGNPSCAGGQCNIACTSPYKDCNGDARADGCEVNTNTSVAACGSACQPCSNNHGNPSCSGGNCSISCTAPWKDCNGDARGDGCETNTDTSDSHCGGCNQPCATNCMNGSCPGPSDAGNG